MDALELKETTHFPRDFVFQANYQDFPKLVYTPFGVNLCTFPLKRNMQYNNFCLDELGSLA